MRGVRYGLQKLGVYYWRRLMRVRATPHEIALGCACGVFAACTPFLGFQMIIAGLIAALLRVSVPAALIGTFIGNPLSWPAIWSASYVAGAWMLGQDPMLAATQITDGARALGWAQATPVPPSLEETLVNLSPLWAPLLLGGLIVGLLAAAMSYYPTRHAVRVYQTRRLVR